MKKYFIIFFIACFLTTAIGVKAGFWEWLGFGDQSIGDTIQPMTQIIATSTPFSALSTRVHGKDLYLEGNATTTKTFDALTLCFSGTNCRSSWPAGGSGINDWKVLWSGATNQVLTPTSTNNNSGLFITSSSTIQTLRSDALTIANTIDLPDNAVAEADINFATSCGTGNRLYISGGNLACEAAWVTASEQNFWNTTSTWAGFQSEFDSKLNATSTLDLTTLVVSSSFTMPNPTDCSANQFANAIDGSANLTCSALADADIPDTITASNYVRKSTWTDIDNYPTACTAGNAVTGLGDTLTCSAFVVTEADPVWLASNLYLHGRQTPINSTTTNIDTLKIYTGSTFPANDIIDAEVSDTLTCSELTCSDCINATEIEDIYVLIAGDTMTGELIASLRGAMINSTTTNIDTLKIYTGSTFPANDIVDAEVSDTLTCSNVEGVDMGTLTDTNVCQYDLAGTEIDCNLTQDATGACAAGAVCIGGHTHGSAEITEADPIWIATTLYTQNRWATLNSTTTNINNLKIYTAITTNATSTGKFISTATNPTNNFGTSFWGSGSGYFGGGVTTTHTFYSKDAMFEGTASSTVGLRVNDDFIVGSTGNATTTGRSVFGTTQPTNNFGVSGLWVGGQGYFTQSATTTHTFYATGGLFTEGMASSTSISVNGNFAVNSSGNATSTSRITAGSSAAGDSTLELYDNASLAYIVGNYDTKNLFIIASSTTASGDINVNKLFTLDASGNSTTTGTIHLPGIAAGGGGDYAVCINNTTKMITNAGATGCIVSSKRFKENIEPLNVGLSELLQLKPSQFNLKGSSVQEVGLIAEDVDLVDKRLVEYESDGITPRTVRYEELTALIINGIKDLWHDIQTLWRWNEEQDTRINNLEKENQLLKTELCNKNKTYSFCQ